MSQNSACPSVARSDASWSMPPVGAPTKSFSARRDTASRSAAPSPASKSSSSAVVTEHTTAADEDNPAPDGTVLSSAMSTPPTPTPSSRSAQRTPAA